MILRFYTLAYVLHVFSSYQMLTSKLLIEDINILRSDIFMSDVYTETFLLLTLCKCKCYSQL